MGTILNGPNQWNPKGHWEDQQWYDLNNEALGGSWTHPAPLLEHLRPRYRQLIDERTQFEHWGVKDARLCVTWPLWINSLRPYQVVVITVRRAMEDSARSLAKRWTEEVGQPLSLDEASRIQRLYQSHQDEMRSHVDWPWVEISFAALTGSPVETVNFLGQLLGLPVTEEALLFPQKV